MGIRLGGETCWLKRKTGDLLVFFEWWDNERDVLGQGEPTMFIVARAAWRSRVTGARRCCRCSRRTSTWTRRPAHPPGTLIEFAKGACDPAGPRALADERLQDRLGDRGQHPRPAAHAAGAQPRPVREPEGSPIGEVKLVADGKTIVEDEIRH
jgi:hypothetical protein